MKPDDRTDDAGFRPRSPARRPHLLPSLLSTLLLLFCLFLPSFAAAARDGVVWLTIDTIGKGKDKGEDVHLCLPLEWVKKSGEMSWCGEEGEKRIQGPDLYSRFKDLPPGEERVVESTDCKDGKVDVRVRSERTRPGPKIRRFRILIENHDSSEGDLDFAVSLDALSSLGHFLGGKSLGFRDKDGEGELFDQDAKDLKDLPPFEIMRARGEDGGTVIIRAES